MIFPEGPWPLTPGALGCAVQVLFNIPEGTRYSAAFLDLLYLACMCDMAEKDIKLTDTEAITIWKKHEHITGYSMLVINGQDQGNPVISQTGRLRYLSSLCGQVFCPQGNFTGDDPLSLHLGAIGCVCITNLSLAEKLAQLGSHIFCIWRFPTLPHTHVL